MNHRVLLHLLEPGDRETCRVAWFWVDDSEASDRLNRSGTGNLVDFLDVYRASSEAEHRSQSKKSSKKAGKQKVTLPITGLFSGSDLVFLNVSVPTKNKQKMWQALPFVVEEFIVDDIESMSLAALMKASLAGSANSIGGNVRVSLIKQQLLDQWLALFESEGLVWEAIYGLPDLLSPADNELQIVFEEDYGLLKSGTECAQVDGENLNTFFSLMSLENIESIRIFYAKSNKLAANFSKRIKLEQEAEGLVSVELNEFRGSVLNNYLFQADYLDDNFADKNSINLLSSGKNGGGNTYLEPKSWLALAAVICFLVVGQIGLNFSSGFYFQKKADKLWQRGGDHYGKLFKDEKIIDLQHQWNQKINNLNMAPRESEFSHIFPLAMGAFLKQAKNKQDIKLKQFRYNREEGDLKIDLHVKSVDLLEAIKKQLGESGFELSILSANDDKGSIKASILIKSL